MRVWLVWMSNGPEEPPSLMDICASEASAERRRDVSPDPYGALYVEDWDVTE